MKYMLLIYVDEQAYARLSGDERQEITGEYMQLVQQLTKSGKYLAGAPLQPTATATSVRVRDGRQLTTDGPFAETKEQLGGYFLVEATDKKEASGIAARIPGARMGTIEVREVIEVPAVTTA
jgi:hypothetical protein